MKTRLFPVLVLSLVLGAAATAQPSATEIVDRAHQAYTTMMADVESYLLTMDMLGMEHQMYFERIEGAAALDYRNSVRVGPRAAWTTGEEDLPGGATMPTDEVFERLRGQVSLVGEESIDGRRAYALAVADPAAIFDAGELPTDDDFELESMTLYVAADDFMMIAFDGEGTTRHNGQTMPIIVEMRMSDFRTVGSMTHPFLTVMRIGGFEDAISEEELRQLEEARRQLEQLPPAQRAMMEQVMGDQLEQIERMAVGEGMEMEMRITDLQVNVPRPE